MKKTLLITQLFQLIILSAFSQDKHLVDSLENQLKNQLAKKIELQIQSPAMFDTTEANILCALSAAFWGSNPDKSLELAKQALALSEQIGFKKGIGGALNSIGIYYDNKGDYFQALDYFKKSSELYQEIGFQKGIASNYNNIGVIYKSLGNYPEAIKYYLASLKIKEAMGNNEGIAASYLNIGIIYNKQGNYAEALTNYETALQLLKKSSNKRNIAACYNNIGSIYQVQSNYSAAIKNYQSALQIFEDINNKEGLAATYHNIGIICSKQNNYSEALKNYFIALKIREEIGDKRGQAAVNKNIGSTYTDLKKYHEAKTFLNKSIALSTEIASVENIKESYEALAKLDSAQNDFKQALVHYKLYISFRDSLLNNENIKKITQSQMQFEFDKKQVADSLRFAVENEIAAVKLQKQKIITYSGFFGIAITIVLLFFVYRNYTKQRIANQKLKEAQEQLIKSEKMAAFGIMASRVSHEIQNPLNFVNNFSELSKDLVTDLINSDSEEEKKQQAAILNSNLEKINEHGKRAAAIVKQMQEHTAKGTAQDFFEES